MFSFRLANKQPAIHAQSRINVTVGKETSFHVNVSDADGDVVTLWHETSITSDFIFNNVTGVLTWTPNDSKSVNLT